MTEGREKEGRKMEKITIEIEEKIEIERPEMLAEVLPVYLSDYSIYPDEVRVSFGNGITLRFGRVEDQPKPELLAALQNIRNMRVGYQYQAPKQRRRGRK